MADIIEYKYEVTVKLRRDDGKAVTDEDDYLGEEILGAIEGADPGTVNDEDETAYLTEDFTVTRVYAKEVMPES